MASRRILVIEDEEVLRRVVVEALERAGYDVVAAEDGAEGMRCFEERYADLVVADIMMPRMDGFEMVRRMRARHPNTLFIFLSARSGAEDVVEGFHVGGHDYLRKPFAISELMVRVEALLSRLGSDTQQSHYAIGSYLFDVERFTLQRGEQTVRLSARESAILSMLAANKGRVVSSRAMLLDLWGDDSYYNLRSLNVFISKLRGYLSADHRVQIIAVRGVGYKLMSYISGGSD